jgi:hypothetical protein
LNAGALLSGFAAVVCPAKPPTKQTETPARNALRSRLDPFITREETLNSCAEHSMGIDEGAVRSRHKNEKPPAGGFSF